MLYSENYPGKNPRVEDLRKRLRNLHILADFLAAQAFLIGSVMFYFKTLEITSITLFVIGSVLFAAKPSLRVLFMIKRGQLQQELRFVAEDVSGMVSPSKRDEQQG